MGFGARRAHSPPFQGVAAPLIKRSRSLAAQTGWLVISNKIRTASRAYEEAARPFINHPVCAAEERDLLIEAQPPLLEKEGNELASTTVIDFISIFGRFRISQGRLIINQQSIFISQPQT